MQDNARTHAFSCENPLIVADRVIVLYIRSLRIREIEPYNEGIEIKNRSPEIDYLIDEKVSVASR